MLFSFPQGGAESDNLLTPKLSDNGPLRLTCRWCGTRVANRITSMGMTAVFPSLLSTPLPAEYAPAMHIWYAERVVDVNDNLPKHEGFPAIWEGADDEATKAN